MWLCVCVCVCVCVCACVRVCVIHWHAHPHVCADEQASEQVPLCKFWVKDPIKTKPIVLSEVK